MRVFAGLRAGKGGAVSAELTGKKKEKRKDMEVNAAFSPSGGIPNRSPRQLALINWRTARADDRERPMKEEALGIPGVLKKEYEVMI